MSRSTYNHVNNLKKNTYQQKYWYPLPSKNISMYATGKHFSLVCFVLVRTRKEVTVSQLTTMKKREIFPRFPFNSLRTCIIHIRKLSYLFYILLGGSCTILT